MRERELHFQPGVGPAPVRRVLGVVEAVGPARAGGEVEVREVEVGVAVPGLLGQRGGLRGQPLVL